MNNDADHQDDLLRTAFHQLRKDDFHRAPGFESLATPRRSWQLRRGVLAFGLGCTVALLSLLVFLRPHQKPVPIADSRSVETVEAIVFEELSALVSRELKIVPVSEWRSPTSFLLNSDS